MPVIRVMVPETAESITRPIVFGVVRDLLKVTGLDPQTPIFFPNESEAAYQIGSTISASSQGVTTDSNARVAIEVQEEYAESMELTTATVKPEHRFIFRDDALQIYLKPAYSASKITIEFKYRSVDKTAAERWRDGMAMRLSEGQSSRLHALTYHYLIPKELLVILRGLHTLREKVAGYGETYEEYFAKHASTNASELSNLAGEQKAWGIAETQGEVLGWFAFTNGPERGSKEGDTDTWVTSVSYQFLYDRPVKAVMRYPIMIHNQVVPANRRPAPSDQVKRPDQTRHSYSVSRAAFAHFEKGRGLGLTPQQPGISLPAFDEFIPSSIIPSTLRVFTTLVQIDTTNPLFLFDLNDLGPHWKLHPDILAYFRRVHAKLPHMNRTPFMLSLYEDDDLISRVSLEVRPDLKVYALRPLSLRRQYHVRLGLSYDWRSIDPGCWDDLRNDGCTLLQIIDAVDPTLRERGFYPKMVGQCFMPRAELEATMNEFERFSRGSERYQFNTVATLFVDAQSINTLKEL